MYVLSVAAVQCTSIRALFSFKFKLLKLLIYICKGVFWRCFNRFVMSKLSKLEKIILHKTPKNVEMQTSGTFFRPGLHYIS